MDFEFTLASTVIKATAVPAGVVYDYHIANTIKVDGSQVVTASGISAGPQIITATLTVVFSE
jgi:hypothetical protein